MFRLTSALSNSNKQRCCVQNTSRTHTHSQYNGDRQDRDVVVVVVGRRRPSVGPSNIVTSVTVVVAAVKRTTETRGPKCAATVAADRRTDLPGETEKKTMDRRRVYCNYYRSEGRGRGDGGGVGERVAAERGGRRGKSAKPAQWAAVN